MRSTPRIVSSLLIGLLLATGMVACGDEANPSQEVEGVEIDGEFHQYRDLIDGAHADHRAMHEIIIHDADSARAHFSEEGTGQFEYPDPFQQVGLRLEAQSTEELSFRAQRDDESWTEWNAVDVYWSEDRLHNALILLDEPATTIEISGGESITFAQMEFSEEIIARAELIRSDDSDLDREIGNDDIRTVQQAQAPASLVTSRSGWGANNPGRICGNVVDPYRMAIHHTAVPSSDGDLYATMRGMQNYHMNNNGWCDIGYHFVVAQSGEILQGRSRSNRPGAHVGGQNSGNVGISLIGNYTSSVPPSVQLQNVATMVRWVHDTHGVAMNRTSVKGHREHAGQWTSCPGDQVVNRLDEILTLAGSSGQPDPEPEPEPNYGVDLRVELGGLENFYQQGTSESVPDGFGGEQFTADILVTNQSDSPIRGVEVAYAFDALGVDAVQYQIDTDHPGYEEKDWQVNSAHDEPANPAHTEMGSEGTLVMHAFSPNETKRVRVTLRTGSYNIGQSEFSGVRAWVKNIDDVYAQSSYDADPSTNVVGHVLRESARVDVLSRSEWQFQAGEIDDLEGWTGRGPHDRLSINTNYDLLAQRVTGLDSSVVSPSWTRIDADAYDELVLRVRSHDGAHMKAVYWARQGEQFNERQVIRFEAEGDTEFHTLVIPMGDHPEWTGEIHQFRIDSNEDLEVGEEDSGWYDIDHIYFQNRASGVTSSRDLGVADEDPSEVDLGAGAPDVEDGGDVVGDGDRPMLGDTPGQDGGHNIVDSKSGCSVAGEGAPGTSWLLVVAALGLMGLRRRDAQPVA